MKDAQGGCGATCGREGPGQVRSPSAAPPESRSTSPRGRPGAWQGPQPHSPCRDPGSIVPPPAPQRAAAIDAAPGPAPRGHAPFAARGLDWRALRPMGNGCPVCI
ncbi:zinc finger CCHC domain-containing protein 2-like [Onychomys torridus]|uniref:zinc finger CCHC domain-containing protein 2-like n=1 Tax=Onychomys torridus TaxID=38674 RepID=UPI00167F83D9|nr:zinc finger CCHC domain-containing protein 2-like [Onychomys torridus]